MSRDCNNCIYHIENGCRTWSCNYISIEEAENAVNILKILHYEGLSLLSKIPSVKPQIDNDTGYVGIDEDYPVSIKQVLNITAETGALETQRRVKELQRYAQLEPSQVARDIATIIENEQDMRVNQKNAEIEELERKNSVLMRLINEMLEEQQECKET